MTRHAAPMEDRRGTDIPAHPNFEADKARGDVGEEYVRSILATSHQVKMDELAVNTGNLYFERMDNPGGMGWRPSGWQKCDAHVWTHVVGFVTISLPLWVLAHVCERLWVERSAFRRECMRGSCPTQGICPPIQVFMEYASEAYNMWRRGVLTGPSQVL